MEEAVKLATALHFSDRIPVVSKDGKPLMPCKPSKARKLLEQNKAVPKWSKLGLFYIQLLIEVKSVYNNNQSLVLASDPGSKFDGFALGCKYIQLRMMAVLPSGVHKKMETRRNLRRAKRFRNTRRRPCRPRSQGPDWIAPSQLAKVQFRLAIIKELCKLFPVTHFIVEDVRFDHYNKRYGKYFSTVEIGKTVYYAELRKLGILVLVEGWQTKLWRENTGLKKCSSKSKLAPESHANDTVAMLIGLAGCEPDNVPFWVYRRPEFARRSLHRQHFQKGGIRPKFGGTCNNGIFRKGDFVVASKAGKTYKGWVCGLPTIGTNMVGVMDANGKRISQFTPSKVRLLARSGDVLSQRLQ